MKVDSIQISTVHDSNNENHILSILMTKTMESSPEEEVLPTSLAQELNAVREKIQRLKIDGNKTENILKERDLLLDNHMKELEWRGQLQKQLEIEVDRLYRLKQLRSPSYMRISPIRSLREKENGSNLDQDHTMGINNTEQKNNETSSEIVEE